MIFLDTNVISETLRNRPEPAVIRWLIEHDAELALSTVVIGELAYGIDKIRPDERASRLGEGLAAWRKRFQSRTFVYCEEAAQLYGELMGKSSRTGQTMSAPDGMIAAVSMLHDGALATRNISDFSHLNMPLFNPWDRVS